MKRTRDFIVWRLSPGSAPLPFSASGLFGLLGLRPRSPPHARCTTAGSGRRLQDCFRAPRPSDHMFVSRCCVAMAGLHLELCTSPTRARGVRSHARTRRTPTRMRTRPSPRRASTRAPTTLTMLRLHGSTAATSITHITRITRTVTPPHTPQDPHTPHAARAPRTPQQPSRALNTPQYPSTPLNTPSRPHAPHALTPRPHAPHAPHALTPLNTPHTADDPHTPQDLHAPAHCRATPVSPIPELLACGVMPHEASLPRHPLTPAGAWSTAPLLAATT